MLTDYINLKLSMSYFMQSIKEKGILVQHYINEFYLFCKDTSQVFFPLQRLLGID